jgi:peptidoglycan/xylan/chitin deacetylase (PgdA/CDA1 family)
VLPLPQAVSLLREGRLPARALCITFDDGYADNFTLAAPILKRLHLPASFFIATGFWSGGVMWNDALIESIRATRLARIDCAQGVFELPHLLARRQAVETLIGRLKYLPAAAREAAVADIVRAARVPPARDLMMSKQQVRALSHAGMTIGAHTVSHPILAMLPQDAARHEICDSRHMLEDLLQIRIGLFAYPNGKPGQDYASEQVAMVREAGFDAALTTAIGSADRTSDPMQLPRFTPWQRGLLPFRAALTLNLTRTARPGPSASVA